MRTIRAPLASAACVCVTALLAACTGSVSTTDTTPSATTSQFTVSGTVSGLAGSNLALQNNGGDTLAVAANGNFTFATPMITGDSYSITVLTDPTAPIQECAIANGTGTIGNSNVTGVTVTCTDKTTTTDTIGGTVVGLLGSGLVLQDNNGDNLSIAANGAFIFATPLAAAAPYSVSVLSPPINPYQDCAVTNAAGITGATDVTNVQVSCKTNSNPAYTIGGTVSGITGTGSVVLQDEGRDNLTISADGSFQFATPIPSGSTYNVTSLQVTGSQSLTCSITNGSGIVGSSNVTNVSVACKPNGVVSVTVSGLSGGGLVLQDNGGDNLAINANGKAAFPTALATGTAYRVTVFTQPANPTQVCVVGNGAGTVTAGAATAVTVTCTTLSFSVGGSVSGLSGGGLTLQDNGGDTLSVTANGSFVFPTPIASGANFSVSVATQPTAPYQSCVVSAGSGTVTSGDITNVAVTCIVNTYTVGGTVTGLSGSGLVLQDNGGNNLAVTANGIFTFSSPVASGGAYSVSVLTQPSSPSQTCTVGSGAGTIINGGVVNVTLTCTTNKYTVGGSVAGLRGSGLVLQDNGGNNLAVAASGAFAFTTPVTSGAPYAVTVLTQPTSPSQTCTVGGSTGTVTSANIGTVTINCTTNTYTVGGTVTGLSGTGLVLQDNGGNDLTVASGASSGPSAAIPFSFSTPVASGTPYAVTVLAQPGSPSQTCTVGGGAGTVTSANIGTVTINCTTNTYPVGGTVSGLAGSGLTLTDNGGDSLAVTRNGTFVFATPVSSGAGYSVAVSNQPTGLSQTCTISAGSGSGTVTASAVTSIVVTCTTNTYTVGGTVRGLAQFASGAATGLTLQDNGTSNFSVNANGSATASFQFATTVASGGTYGVTTFAVPEGYTCVVANGAGTITNANVTSVIVTCGEIGAYLYVTNSADDTISIFSVDKNSGALLPLAGGPVATGTQTPISMVRGCTYSDFYDTLYVASSGSNTVSSYLASRATGALSVITSPVSTLPGTSPEFIDSTDSGCFAITLNNGTNSLSSFSTTSSATTLAAGPIPADGDAPIASANLSLSDANNNEFDVEYVANEVSGTISAFNVNPTTGAFTEIGAPTSAGTNPDGVAAAYITDTNNRVTDALLYVANAGSATISEYSVDANTGALSLLTEGNTILTAATGAGPGAMKILELSPAGTSSYYLYVANSTDGTLSGYQINNTLFSGCERAPCDIPPIGTLQPINVNAGTGGATIATGSSPVAMTTVAFTVFNGDTYLSSYYLYVVNNASDSVSVYSINTSNGTLTEVLGSPFATGTAPTSVLSLDKS
jgi:6-phosphogluconolactonase (cycloisomerase 2 family)